MEYTSVLIALLIAAVSAYFLFFADGGAKTPAAEPPKEAAPAPAAAAAPAPAAAAAAPAATAAPAAAAPAAAAPAAAAPAAAAPAAAAPAANPAPAPKKAAAAGELPSLLVTRPNKPGEPDTLLLLTHRAGQVDFKLAVVRNVEGSGWEYFDTMADPETTGSFKLAVDGSTLDVFATAPRKWCMKFVREADGSYKCTSPDYPGTTAVACDISPAPSKLGAGGLPKGQVNLGEQDEDVRGGGRARRCVARARARARAPRSPHPPFSTLAPTAPQAYNPLGF
jgi:hypothetical protein